ncbi:DUF2817 domain-containing protein [Halalkalibacillus sediminis]|uniref:DUF2817 domain-containing protein n=1 Tax=Halalkalibacillus sediminis TaxID=2018042 RepID=A0A2I0QU15_9BACI|nr:M14 family metallopeptidase [Halalkalibacillus sediminis]PKR77842.1 DUF2817 domain-containing protein [Halalkalibacillus sediminis]
MKDTEIYLKNTYEESRETFRGHLDKIKENWPEAELFAESIAEGSDYTIDTIYADATEENEQVIFFSTGLHGIEGYAGAAMVHLFVEEYMDKVDPETTGICFVHAINPWGMKNLRRVNENNVDLNRNCFYKPLDVPRDINVNYSEERNVFLPNGQLKDVKKEKQELYEQLSKGALDEGYSGLKSAKGMGQFEFEKGVYFGGNGDEPSTEFVKKMQRKLLESFRRVIHMDWHTALGPTNEITMLNSEVDSRSGEELSEKYGLENISKFSPEDVKGDSTNHFNELKREEFPDRYLVSALFEFGTFGTDKMAELREFTTIILENQLYWEGAEKEDDRQWVLKEFENMFYPDDEEWRESVLKEGRLGIEKILGEEKVI